MRLAIFDIDGTLTRTHELDSGLYAQAVCEVFGLEAIDTDWSGYAHVTDLSIASEVYQRAYGAAPGPATLLAMGERFAAIVNAHLAERPGDSPEVPGAAALLAELAAHPGWTVALASGGFTRTARLKLAAAGLANACAGLAAAFTEDGNSREELIAAAIARAQAQTLGRSRLAGGVGGLAREGAQTGGLNGLEYESIVSLGDGLWDLRTARALGYGFIGIASDAAAEQRLRGAGARLTLRDFSDREAVWQALEAAAAEYDPRTNGASRRAIAEQDA